MTSVWWVEPIAGEIVWCHFPDNINPRPKPRPALILAVFDDDAPQFHVRVAYGTSQRTTTLHSGEFAILRARNTLAGSCSKVREVCPKPTLFNPPISIHAIGNPAAGTRRASNPWRVPINTDLWPRRRNSRATAREGITCPPVPPPAMRNVNDLIRWYARLRSATGQARAGC